MGIAGMGRDVKLATITVDAETGTENRVAVAADDAYLDVTAGYARLLADDGEPAPSELAAATAPSEMQAFLEAGERAMDAARRVEDELGDTGDVRGPDGARIRYAPADVRLRAPLPRPLSIRDCMAFEEHVRNATDRPVPDVWYERPLYYKGNPGSVVDPGADVAWPDYTERLDYELEIAAIVGTEGSDVDAADADSYIAGYTVFDDFSARDVQGREMEGTLGPAKGKDFANGFGPYLVTPDEFDLASASARAYVNDELWSEGELGEMEHSFADILEYVSDGETLYPGDIVGSGTVGGGCGLELDKWLSPGDEVALEVDGLGRLVHRVVR